MLGQRTKNKEQRTQQRPVHIVFKFNPLNNNFGIQGSKMNYQVTHDKGKNQQKQIQKRWRSYNLQESTLINYYKSYKFKEVVEKILWINIMGKYEKYHREI